MLLVTGITGHSGSYFLKELIDNNYEGSIRCVVRETSDTSLIDNCGLHIEKVVGDLSNQDFMDKSMIGIDTVLHIGTIFYSVIVTKAAVKNNVRRAILVHTTGIYSKYKSASEEYKNIESEVNKIINTSQISLIILRPTMIYGNIIDNNMVVFIRMVDKLRIFPVIDHGRSLLQPVNGRDLGKAYYQVLANPDIMNGDYILSGEKPITMLNMFKLISNTLGKKTTFISVPLGFGVFLARILKAFTLGKVDYIEKVQRMGENRSFPHDAAFRDFGYNPMQFEDGIKLEVEQYLKEKTKN
jgi:nucleoside-diphosphate-sugar epimerase